MAGVLPGSTAGTSSSCTTDTGRIPRRSIAETRAVFEQWTPPAEACRRAGRQSPLQQDRRRRSTSRSRSAATDISPPSSIRSGLRAGRRSLAAARDPRRHRRGSARAAGDADVVRRSASTRRTCSRSIAALRRIYCSTTGYDYCARLRARRSADWLRQAAEAGRFRAPADPIDPVALLERLTQVEVFERFLHRTFPGKTRFSIEGLDMLVPILDEVIGEAAEAGIRSILIGMAHRGRLNVMAHVLQQAVRADSRRVQGAGVVAQRSARTWRGPAT